MSPSEKTRLSARRTAAEAVGLLRTRFDAAWAFWFLLFVVKAAVVAATILLGVKPGAPPFAPIPLALDAGQTVAGAVLGAMALRALLGHERPIRPDRGFWAYLGLSVLGGAGWAALAAYSNSLAVRALEHPTDMALAPQLLGLFAGMLVLAYLFARLLLWPISKLMGRPGIGPAASWRRMGGAIWALLGGNLLLTIPVTLTGAAILMAVNAETPTLGAAPLLGLMGALFEAAELAVMAVIWTARGHGEAPAPPAVDL